jgi:hypothetical protein
MQVLLFKTYEAKNFDISSEMIFWYSEDTTVYTVVVSKILKDLSFNRNVEIKA